jgi:hypothetical protein
MKGNAVVNTSDCAQMICIKHRHCCDFYFATHIHFLVNRGEIMKEVPQQLTASNRASYESNCMSGINDAF